MEQIIIIYLITINIAAFVLYGIDKYKAKHQRWRISEGVLIGIALVGGSVGAFLGMKAWRHKTQHKKFKYGLPIILLLQIAVAAYLSMQ